MRSCSGSTFSPAASAQIASPAQTLGFYLSLRWRSAVSLIMTSALSLAESASSLWAWDFSLPTCCCLNDGPHHEDVTDSDFRRGGACAISCAGHDGLATRPNP